METVRLRSSQSVGARRVAAQQKLQKDRSADCLTFCYQVVNEDRRLGLCPVGSLRGFR